MYIIVDECQRVQMVWLLQYHSRFEYRFLLVEEQLELKLILSITLFLKVEFTCALIWVNREVWWGRNRSRNFRFKRRVWWGRYTWRTVLGRRSQNRCLFLMSFIFLSWIYLIFCEVGQSNSLHMKGVHLEHPLSDCSLWIVWCRFF